MLLRYYPRGLATVAAELGYAQPCPPHRLAHGRTVLDDVGQLCTALTRSGLGEDGLEQSLTLTDQGIHHRAAAARRNELIEEHWHRDVVEQSGKGKEVYRLGRCDTEQRDRYLVATLVVVGTGYPEDTRSVCGYGCIGLEPLGLGQRLQLLGDREPRHEVH